MGERELRRYGLTLNRVLKSGELEKAAQVLGYRIADDLLAGMGYGKVSPLQLLQQLLPADKLAETPPAGEPPATSRITELFRKMARRPTEGVRINGIDDVLVRYGKCCNPVPGDAIVGYITRGRGVTVHTLACEKTRGIDPERRVDVAWDVRSDLKRPVSLRVVTNDRPGILAQISRSSARPG